VRRITVFVSVIVVALVALAGTAWAHVTVEPSSAPKGSDAVLTFIVPTEKENATTTKVEVQFPTDHPIADALVQAMPGWNAVVATGHSDTAIHTDNGDVNTKVNSVTWTATDGKGIPKDHFAQFAVSVGLPDDADSLSFPAIQTYSDGSTVNWVQATPAGGPEPDNPAPVLTLTATEAGSSTPTTAPAAGSASSTVKQSDVDNAKTLAIIGVIVGALGLIAAVAAIVTSRRKAAS
jgi:periplasmic copper chaperone A